MWHAAACAKGISIEVSAADRDRLERIVADRNSPQSMSGGLRSSWRRRKVVAPPRSGAGPRCPSLASGAGKNAYAGGRGRPGARQDPQARIAALAAGRGRSGWSR
jgi:hypothetical protein